MASPLFEIRDLHVSTVGDVPVELLKSHDIDALRTVTNGVRAVREQRPTLGVLAITHYRRLLDELQPDHVHTLVDGRIVDSGGSELAARLEREGYDAWR